MGRRASLDSTPAVCRGALERNAADRRRRREGAEDDGGNSKCCDRREGPTHTSLITYIVVHERERGLVAEAGFAAAVTTEPGANRPGDDPLTLRRIQVERGDDLLAFQAKVAGAFDRPLAGRALYRRLRYRPSSSS